MKEEVPGLFRELADLSPDERALYLEQHRVSPDVRAEVESLLAFDSQTGSSLGNSVATEAEDLLLSSVAARTGRRCGPYRLVHLLGRGGAGAVFLAERIDGQVEHRVAIKLLRQDTERRAFRDRFLQERQILASLQHPGIARLLDAGQTEDGKPYLVMDYIDGLPIDAYAAHLNPREKLHLFLRVCDAVSYAHQNLIVHRDLKPSNILVDASGEPKLLDFGIAKILDVATDRTLTQERLLTPDYASPEQVRGAVQSTATDVYSLGAVLYDLLTGQSPHAFPTRTPEAIDAAICTTEPAPASSVNPELAQDLDFILLKALRKEPEERYSSVEALANDIRAFLEWRPIRARSGNAWYRTRKFVRRYWVPVLAAALVVASLSVGLYVANRERTLAQRRFQDVRQISNKLFDIDFEVSRLPGSTKARQMIVDTSLEYLRRLTADAKGDPELVLEVGNAYRYVAEVEGVTTGPNLGQLGNAERDLTTAEGLIESVLRTQPANRTALLRAAEVASDRMAVAWQGGRYEGSLAFARKSAEWLDKFNPGRADQRVSREILHVYANVAHQYMMAEHLDEALQLSSRGSDLALLFDQPVARAGFLDTRALSLRYQGDLGGALSTIRESVRLNESAPAGFAREINLAMALSREGWILGGGDNEGAISLGRPEEAVEILDRAFKIADDLVHKDASDESARSRLFMAGYAMAEILRPLDARRALAVYDHTYRDMSQVSSRLLQIWEVNLLAGSSDALRSLGHPAEARERLDEAFALLGRLKLYPAKEIEAGEAERALRALADYEADTGNLPRAIQVYEGLLDRLKAAGASPETSLQDAVTLSHIFANLAALYQRRGQPDPASSLEARRLEVWRQWDRKLPGNPFVLRQLGKPIVH